MKQIKSTEAAKGFGQLVDDVQNEPVTIERNGRPVAVIYSYVQAQEIERMKLEVLKRFVGEGIKDVAEGRVRQLTQEVKDEIKAGGLAKFRESQK